MKKKDILFFVGLYLLLIQLISNTVVIFDISSKGQNIMQVIAALCLITKIMIEGVSLKEAILKGIILLIAFANYIICDISGIFISILIIMSVKNMDINKIIKSIAVPMTIFISILIALYFIEGIFGDSVINSVSKFSLVKQSNRAKFYYIHPNSFASQLTWTALMWIYLKYDKINFVTYFMMFCLVVFIYVFPNSRTNALILLLSIFIILIYRKFNGKKIRWFQKNIYNICLILSFVLLFTFDRSNPISNGINVLLTGRIAAGWYTYKLFGIPLLGQILPIGETLRVSDYHWIMTYAVDNAYYRLLFQNGVVILAICTLFMNKKIKSLVDTNNVKDLIFFTILCIFGVSETVVLNILIAFPLLFFKDTEKLFAKQKSSNELLPPLPTPILPVKVKEVERVKRTLRLKKPSV